MNQNELDKEHDQNTIALLKGIAKVFFVKALGVAFLALLIMFIIPAFFGIVNAGNIAGIIFCAVMLIYTWGYEFIHIFVEFIKQYKWGRAVVNVIAAVFLAGVVYVLLLSGLMLHADTTEPQDDCTVIVLGCQVRGESPSLMLSQRVEAAYEYLAEHPDVPCIVSGGKGDGENISEAQCMYNLLTEMGIDPDRIYMEDSSVNTRENISCSKRIIEENGFSTNTAIVTDVFHEYRASGLVKAAGLTYGSVPADCVWYLVPTYYVRELIGITASFVGLA